MSLFGVHYEYRYKNDAGVCEKMRRGITIIGIITILYIVFALVGCGTKNKDETLNIMPSKQETEKEETAENDEEMKKDSEAEQNFTGNDAVSVWTTANVNLRQMPNTASAVIKVISAGAEVEKFSEENGWAYVKVGEEKGYVSMQYISDTKIEETEATNENVSPTTPIKVEAIPGQHRDPNTAVVVIDPGHQLRGDSTKEPNGPSSSVMKARVTSGTTGVATGVPEYVMNLDISLKLKTELENRGYTVYMTRSVHEVNISNKERAEYATTVGADIAVRIHGNGSSNSGVHGAEAYVPSANNPYVSHLAKASNSLGKSVIDAYCAATGFRNRGVIASDTMTGMNWSSVPVTILEVGYMSNADEDRRMQDATIQNNMVQGIANGIDAYFGF